MEHHLPVTLLVCYPWGGAVRQACGKCVVCSGKIVNSVQWWQVACLIFFIITIIIIISWL